MKIAVVGATGLVGREILKVLENMSIDISELLVVASDKSVGKSLPFSGNDYQVISLETAVAKKPDIAIFSAGANVSLEWAPRFKSAGTTVIDNSSAWRMAKEIPLIVPEINGNILTEKDKIIEDWKERTPQKRIADPADIASVAGFLLSEEASWIQGQTIVADGGLTL